MGERKGFDAQSAGGYIAKGVLDATLGVAVGLGIIWVLRFFALIPGSDADWRTTFVMLGLLWLAMVVMRLYMGLSGKWKA